MATHEGNAGDTPPAARSRRDLLVIAAAAPAVAGLAAGPAEAAPAAGPGERQSLEDRVRRLEDLEDIYRLRKMYHYFINENLPDRFSEIYLPDATLVMDERVKWEGVKRISDQFRLLPSRTTLIKQFMMNHVVDLQGDAASGFCYFQANYAPSVGPTKGKSMIVSGRYDENYVRTPAGWRIARTKINVFYFVPLDMGFAGEQRDFYEKH